MKNGQLFTKYDTLVRGRKSDYIIYLDYSTLTQVIGIMKRFFKNHSKEKEEIPGCKEQMNWKFFWFVVNWRKNKRKEVLEKISKVSQEKVLIFHNRKQLNKWYRNIFNKKIKC